jgi:hypothetical protein
MREPFPWCHRRRSHPSGPHANKTRCSQQWRRTDGWLTLGCRAAGEIPATRRWPRTNLARSGFRRAKGAVLMAVPAQRSFFT